MGRTYPSRECAQTGDGWDAPCQGAVVSTDGFTLKSGDGLEIYVHVWRPTQEPKAAVQVAHGMAEHALRYTQLAEALNQQGYIVYANDHRGHGRSIGNRHRLGHMGEDDTFHRAVEDMYELNRKIDEAHDAVPKILLGHSMGSFMVQAFLWQYPEAIEAAVLSGSNGKPPPIAQLGRIVARVEQLRLGKTGKSQVIDAMAFKDFNRKFRPNRTAFDWLSRDESEVDAYIADPLCGFIVSTQSWVDLLDVLGDLVAPNNLARIPKDRRIYIFGGARDAVSDMGAGAKRLARVYRKAGLEHVDIKLYPDGRHEMLHETNRTQVTEDVVRWLDDTVAELS